MKYTVNDSYVTVLLPDTTNHETRQKVNNALHEIAFIFPGGHKKLCHRHGKNG